MTGTTDEDKTLWKAHRSGGKKNDPFNDGADGHEVNLDPGKHRKSRRHMVKAAMMNRSRTKHPYFVGATGLERKPGAGYNK
jgi:hypothetical protein